MLDRPLKVAIIGCGNIAKTYAEQLEDYEEIDLVGFSDLDQTRAIDMAKSYDSYAYSDTAELYQDANIDLIVNLTIHSAHFEINRSCLENNKHVYSEKPLACSFKEASDLVDIATQRGKLLFSAPITFLGESQQATWNLLDNNRLGKLRLAYAEINHGRIENWHPNPKPFYDIGVLWDVAIYPLTLLTAYLGPVESVRTEASILYPERQDLEQKSFVVETPDCYVLHLKTVSEVVIRLSANFYALHSAQGSAVEIHGDLGSLVLDSSYLFNSDIHYWNKECSKMANPKAITTTFPNGYTGIEFARGLRWIAKQILAGTESACDPRQALHVIEVLEKAGLSLKQKKRLNLESTFDLQRIRY